MFLIVSIIVLLGVVLCYLWVKLVNLIFNPIIRWLDRKNTRLNKTDNPYIQAHKLKFHNDFMYDEYLKWLNENGGDIPFEKWKTDEEREFDKKFNIY